MRSLPQTTLPSRSRCSRGPQPAVPLAGRRRNISRVRSLGEIAAAARASMLQVACSRCERCARNPLATGPTPPCPSLSLSWLPVAAGEAEWRRKVRQYLAPMILAPAVAAWPGVAGAVRFMDETTGAARGQRERERERWLRGSARPRSYRAGACGQFRGAATGVHADVPRKPLPGRAVRAPNDLRPPPQQRPRQP